MLRLFRDSGLIDEQRLRVLESVLHERMQDESVVAIVARADGDVVAALYAIDNGVHVFLSHLAVAASFRGRGLGATLHAALIELCRERGLRGVLADASLTATPFFYKLGYRTPGAVFLIKDV